MPGYWEIHFDNTQYFKNELYKLHICKLSTSYLHEPLKIDFGQILDKPNAWKLNCGLTEYLKYRISYPRKQPNT